MEIGLPNHVCLLLIWGIERFDAFIYQLLFHAGLQLQVQRTVAPVVTGTGTRVRHTSVYNWSRPAPWTGRSTVVIPARQPGLARPHVVHPAAVQRPSVRHQMIHTALPNTIRLASSAAVRQSVPRITTATAPQQLSGHRVSCTPAPRQAFVRSSVPPLPQRAYSVVRQPTSTLRQRQSVPSRPLPPPPRAIQQTHAPRGAVSQMSLPSHPFRPVVPAPLSPALRPGYVNFQQDFQNICSKWESISEEFDVGPLSSTQEGNGGKNQASKTVQINEDAVVNRSFDAVEDEGTIATSPLQLPSYVVHNLERMRARCKKIDRDEQLERGQLTPEAKSSEMDEMHASWFEDSMSASDLHASWFEEEIE